MLKFLKKHKNLLSLVSVFIGVVGIILNSYFQKVTLEESRNSKLTTQSKITANNVIEKADKAAINVKEKTQDVINETNLRNNSGIINVDNSINKHTENVEQQKSIEEIQKSVSSVKTKIPQPITHNFFPIYSEIILSAANEPDNIRSKELGEQIEEMIRLSRMINFANHEKGIVNQKVWENTAWFLVGQIDLFLQQRTENKSSYQRDFKATTLIFSSMSEVDYAQRSLAEKVSKLQKIKDKFLKYRKEIESFAVNLSGKEKNIGVVDFEK